jgi:hypothetical protein
MTDWEGGWVRGSGGGWVGGCGCGGGIQAMAKMHLAEPAAAEAKKGLFHTHTHTRPPSHFLCSGPATLSCTWTSVQV